MISGAIAHHASACARVEARATIVLAVRAAVVIEIARGVVRRDGAADGEELQHLGELSRPTARMRIGAVFPKLFRPAQPQDSHPGGLLFTPRGPVRSQLSDAFHVKRAVDDEK